MSTDDKKIKELAREDNIEAKLRNTLAQISSVDDKILRLSKHREKLVSRYEELKDEKIIRDARACTLDVDFENGKISMIQIIPTSY